MLKTLVNLYHLIIFIQKHPDEFEPNYHAFYIIIDENRDDLINHLHQKGIQSYIGYVPLHSSTYSKNNNFYKNLETTDYISERVLSFHCIQILKLMILIIYLKALKFFQIVFMLFKNEKINEFFQLIYAYIKKSKNRSRNRRLDERKQWIKIVFGIVLALEYGDCTQM